jgi:hypothetical protein
MLRRLHAREHGVVTALDARHVHEARRAADQRTAGEGELRHGLIAAFGNRSRAIGEAFAALQHIADHRMLLEALEFVERRECRVLIIQVHHEADGDKIFVEMIEERATAGL